MPGASPADGQNLQGRAVVLLPLGPFLTFRQVPTAGVEAELAGAGLSPAEWWTDGAGGIVLSLSVA